MRHILLDTNIVLDVLLDRAPWVNEARVIWQAVDDGHLSADRFKDFVVRLPIPSNSTTLYGRGRTASVNCPPSS